MSSENTNKLVAELRTSIDRLYSDFRKIKDQLILLARVLDETNLCERSGISMKIKELLEDKIKEGKISSKWIEESLPQEYKRKYVKSEPSSLLENKDNNEVQVPVQSVLERGLDSNQGQVLQQENKGSDSTVFKEQHKQKEKQFLQKIEQQGEQIIKQEQIVKEQERELERLRPLAEEQRQQTEQSQLTNENLDLKEQLGKLREENSKFRAELDESKKEGQLKILVDEWTLSKQLSSLRYSGYTKLQIVIENGKYVKIEGAD
jgi:hypothetical protein